MTDNGSRYREAMRVGMSLIDKAFGHGLLEHERGDLRTLMRAASSTPASQLNLPARLSDDDLRHVREALGAALIQKICGAPIH